METLTSDQLTSYSKTSKTAHESHLDLLRHGTKSDVTFIVGPSRERIPCHQLFLIARSPVFEVMFSDRWNQDNNKEIPLEDMDPKIFKKFLEFIYADTILANVPEILELLQVAHYYDVQLLASECEEVLLEIEVTLNDAVDIFQTARKYDKIQLVNKAGDLMAKSLSKLQSHPSFSRLDTETLVYILKRNDLDMKEVDLFRLAVKWAQNQSDLTTEESLEDILPLIRFPIMTLQEFTTNVVPSGLLSHSTLVEIFTYFGTDAETRKSLASTLKFNTQRRRSTDSVHDLYPGDLDAARIRRLQLEKLGDDLDIRTRITGTVAMGIGGISVYCPARAVSSASSPLPSTLKEFRIILQSVIKQTGTAQSRQNLLSMSHVEVEEGKITEIQFATVIPLTDKAHYRIIVDETPGSSGQLGPSTEDFLDVKVFGRYRNRSVSLNMIEGSVVIAGIQENEVQEISDSDSDSDLECEQPQLICRLIVEKL